MKKVVSRIIKAYQLSISPDHGVLPSGMNRCRFYPSCSEYAILAINKFGITRGFFRAFIRIIKCNPLFRGGVDLP